MVGHKQQGSQDHPNISLEPLEDEVQQQIAEQQQDDKDVHNDVGAEEEAHDEQPAGEQNQQQEVEKEGHYGGGRYPRRLNILRIDYYEPEIPDDDEFLCEC